MRLIVQLLGALAAQILCLFFFFALVADEVLPRGYLAGFFKLEGLREESENCYEYFRR